MAISLLDSNQAHAFVTQGLQLANSTMFSTAKDIKDAQSAIVTTVAKFGKDYLFSENDEGKIAQGVSSGSNLFFSFASGLLLSRSLYNPEENKGKCRTCCSWSGQSVVATMLGAVPLATQKSEEIVGNSVLFALGLLTGRVYYNTLGVNHDLKKQIENLRSEVGNLQNEVKKGTENLKQAAMEIVDGIADAVIAHRPKIQAVVKSSTTSDSKESSSTSPPIVKLMAATINANVASSSTTSSSSSSSSGKKKGKGANTPQVE